MTATEEREWWDGHADEIHVWGELGDAAWEIGAAECLAIVTRAMFTTEITGRILDLGCGLGRLSLPLARMNPDVEVIGVDVSPEMLLKAEIDKSLSKVDNVHYRLCDGRHLPDDLGVFDAAYSVLMFQHIPADAVVGYIHEVGKTLRPGGRFVCQFVGGEPGGSFLSWSHHALDVVAWGSVGGLHPVAGSIAIGLLYPEWIWLTLEKSE